MPVSFSQGVELILNSPRLFIFFIEPVFFVHEVDVELLFSLVEDFLLIQVGLLQMLELLHQVVEV